MLKRQAFKLRMGAELSKFALTTGAYRKFAKRGSLKIVLVNKGVAPIERFRISSKYGHSETALTPSVIYDGEGLSMTMSFSKKVETIWQDSVAFDRDGY